MTRPSFFFEEGPSGRGSPNNGFSSSVVIAIEQAEIGDIFKHCQTRAGCLPSVQYIGIGAGAYGHPFHEIEHEGFDVF